MVEATQFSGRRMGRGKTLLDFKKTTPGFQQGQLNEKNVNSFLPCASPGLLSVDTNVQESHQKLKEEPSILEDCFSHHSSADHHLEGKLLVEMLNKNHKN